MGERCVVRAMVDTDNTKVMMVKAGGLIYFSSHADTLKIIQRRSTHGAYIGKKLRFLAKNHENIGKILRNLKYREI